MFYYAPRREPGQAAGAALAPGAIPRPLSRLWRRCGTGLRMRRLPTERQWSPLLLRGHSGHEQRAQALLTQERGWLQPPTRAGGRSRRSAPPRVSPRPAHTRSSCRSRNAPSAPAEPSGGSPRAGGRSLPTAAAWTGGPSTRSTRWPREGKAASRRWAKPGPGRAVRRGAARPRHPREQPLRARAAGPGPLRRETPFSPQRAGPPPALPAPRGPAA